MANCKTILFSTTQCRGGNGMCNGKPRQTEIIGNPTSKMSHRAVFNLYIQLIYRNYKRRCCFWPQLRQLYFSNPEFFASGAAAQGFHALYVCFMCISVGDMSGSRPNTKAQKTWSKTQIWKVALQLNTYATIHVFVFPPSLHRRSASTE